MKITKKALVSGVAVLALAAPLAACGSAGSDSSTGAKNSIKGADYNPQPRSNVKDGGTLTTATVDIPDQLNIFQADGDSYGAQLWQWVNPQMTFFTPDGKWSYNKDFLTDVKSEEKGGNTVVTYTINPKAKWNDGTPITWESYKITAEANSGKDEAYEVSSSDGYSQIKSVTQGKDDHQAIVTFNGPWAWWQGLFGSLLNPHVNSAKAFNESYIHNFHPEWGAGPYTLDSYDQKAGVVTFKRNPKWWGDKGKLDKRVFKQMEDAASINAFKNGELDAVGANTKDRLAQAKQVKDVTILKAGTPATHLLTVNAQGPSGALKDIKVRQALMESIDRKTLDNILFQGLNYSEDLPGSFNLFPFQPGYKDAFSEAGYKSSVADAKKLLGEAGYKAGSNGIMAKAGKPLTLDFPFVGDDPTLEAAAKAIIAMAKKAGFDIKLRNVPDADFSKEFSGNKWDLFWLGFVSSDPYGVAYMCQLYCSDSGLNLSHTGTKELDAKIKALAKIPTQKEQTAAGMKLESEVMSKTWGIMPLYNGTTIFATKKGVANFDPEIYLGPDLFGTLPVQDEGWQK